MKITLCLYLLILHIPPSSLLYNFLFCCNVCFFVFVQLDTCMSISGLGGRCPPPPPSGAQVVTNCESRYLSNIFPPFSLPPPPRFFFWEGGGGQGPSAPPPPTSGSATAIYCAVGIYSSQALSLMSLALQTLILSVILHGHRFARKKQRVSNEHSHTH